MPKSKEKNVELFRIEDKQNVRPVPAINTCHRIKYQKLGLPDVFELDKFLKTIKYLNTSITQYYSTWLIKYIYNKKQIFQTLF